MKQYKTIFKDDRNRFLSINIISRYVSWPRKSEKMTKICCSFHQQHTSLMTLTPYLIPKPRFLITLIDRQKLKFMSPKSFLYNEFEMAQIAYVGLPLHGHTNPTLPIMRELAHRDHSQQLKYSFLSNYV